ncbi:MAG: hypothetical protein ABWY06_01735 [Pseudomonas sp.]|uniref:hypothetical protein n=1 Tax=Pseudomonas sp. TaxID=306 RepID=UPI0033973F7E
MIQLLRLSAALGCVLFTLAFAATFVAPYRIEQQARSFIQEQLLSAVNQRITGLQSPHLTLAAGVLAERFQGEVASLEQDLRDGLPAKVASVVAQMQDLSCECRQHLSNQLSQAAEQRIGSLQGAQARLHGLIQGQYAQVLSQLLRDLRIFSGTNLAVFLCLLGISLLKPRSTAPLLLPAGLLLLSTVLCSYAYLFQQDWFFTLIFGSYLGYAYAAVLLSVFLLLGDVALNRARVCGRVLASLGSAPPMPC